MTSNPVPKRQYEEKYNKPNPHHSKPKLLKKKSSTSKPSNELVVKKKQNNSHHKGKPQTTETVTITFTKTTYHK